MLSLLAAIGVCFRSNVILVVTWVVFLRTLLRIVRVPAFLKSMRSVSQWRVEQHRRLVQKAEDDASRGVEEAVVYQSPAQVLGPVAASSTSGKDVAGGSPESPESPRWWAEKHVVDARS